MIIHELMYEKEDMQTILYILYNWVPCREIIKRYEKCEKRILQFPIQIANANNCTYENFLGKNKLQTTMKWGGKEIYWKSKQTIPSYKEEINE